MRVVDYCVPKKSRIVSESIMLQYRNQLYQIINDELRPIESPTGSTLDGFYSGELYNCNMFKQFESILCPKMYHGLIMWIIEQHPLHNDCRNLYLFVSMNSPIRYAEYFNFENDSLAALFLVEIYNKELVERTVTFLSAYVQPTHLDGDVYIGKPWDTLLYWKGLIQTDQLCGELQMIYSTLYSLSEVLPKNVLRYVLTPMLKIPPYNLEIEYINIHKKPRFK